MVEIRQIMRLLTFGYESCLPNILSFWVLAIIPEIMVNNMEVTEKYLISYYSGMFFSMFFWGMVVGSFFWPTIVSYISKRTCIFISLFMMGFFNYMTGQTKDLNYILFLRFATGVFSNLNSVGKDFVFDFSKDIFRLYAFSIKTQFTFIASFIGPWLGYKLYIWSGKDYTISTYYITLLFCIGLILFVPVFYLDFKEGDILSKNHEEDEILGINDASEVAVEKQKGLFEVLKIILKIDFLRNLILVYFITNGVYKTSTTLVILYIETPWTEQGYGVSSEYVSLVGLVAFIPASILILTCPLFVPKKITYKAFMVFFICTFGVVLFMFPLIRDLVPENGKTNPVWIAYVLLGLMFASVPKLYSPFINFNLNNNIDKFSRTSLNAWTFILSNGAAALFTTIISPLLGYTLYGEGLGNHSLTKYVAFIILDLFLILALWLMRKIQEPARKKRSGLL